MSIRLDIQIIVEETDSKPLTQTVDLITALICYREVRRYITALRPFHAFQHLDDKDCRDLIYIFRIDYPEQTIREAIEKYKNEQNDKREIILQRVV